MEALATMVPLYMMFPVQCDSHRNIYESLTYPSCESGYAYISMKITRQLLGLFESCDHHRKNA